MSSEEVEIFPGDAMLIKFKIVDEDGEDFPLTGYGALKFMVKANKDDIDGDALLTKTDTDFTVTSASHGEMELQLLNADTKNITVGRNWYELQISDGTNNYTVAQGYFTVKEKVIDVA